MTTPRHPSHCLSDETIASLAEGLLPPAPAQDARAHIQTCGRCRELLNVYAAVAHAQGTDGLQPCPPALTARARDLVPPPEEGRLMTLIARFSEAALENIDTTARIIYAPWIPLASPVRGQTLSHGGAAVMEHTFGAYTCRVELSRPQASACRLAVRIENTQNTNPLPRGRVILRRDGRQLESHPAENGCVVFEEIPLGTYRITILDIEDTPWHLDVHLVRA